LLAIASTGQTRVFRATFALAGAVYMLIVMCSIFSPIRDSLLTSRVLVFTANALQVPTYVAIPAQPAMPTGYYAPYTSSPASLTGTVTVATAPQPAIPSTTPSSGTLALSGGNAYPSPTLTTTYIAAGPYSAGDPMDSILSSGYFSFNYQIPAVSFLIIGHCLWAWLLALLAGWFASVMYAKYQRNLAAAQPNVPAA
jgi:hypothetical protein